MKGLAIFDNMRFIMALAFLFVISFQTNITANTDSVYTLLKVDAKVQYKKLIQEQDNITYEIIDSIIFDKPAIYKGAFLLELSKTKLSNNQFLEVDSLVKESLLYFTKFHSASGKADAFFIAGKNAIAQNNHQEILSYFSQAANNYSKSKNLKGVIYSYIRIANYFSRNDNNKLAEKYYSLALNSVTAKSQKSLKEMILLNFANHYNKTSQHEKALSYYLTLEQLIDKRENNKRLAFLYHNLGSLYLRKEMWDDAETYLLKALQIKKNHKDTNSSLSTLQNLFRVSLRQNDLIKASYYNSQLKEFLIKNKPTNEILLDYSFNSIIYHILRDSTKHAIKEIDRYVEAKDSLSNLAFSDKLIEMEKSFELQEKDREIELLQKEDALQKARLNNQKLLTLSVAVVALLLLGIGLLINRQRRRLKKSQNILKQRKEEIVNINEELRLSNESKDRILSVIGHDLRGPVGGLKELIDLYMDLGEFEQQDVHNLLSAARESSTSTYHLLENLLSWANSQRGQINFEPETTNLQKLICHTVNLLDNSVNTRNIRFKCDVPEELYLYVDKNMLSTIVRNLVANAIKFSPENSQISVSVTELPNDISFCIADEGIGFSAKESENLFTHKETYFLDKGNTAKGTGLGLILCKEFVERHGGRIWTESNLKKGAKVCFSIPKELSELTPMDETPAKKTRSKWRSWTGLY